MHKVTTTKLARDCEAVQIPIGSSVMLPAGMEVDITQTLGGSFTIHAMGGLFRIAAKDAEALGMFDSTVANAAIPASSTNTAGEVSVDEKTVWDTLKTCFDPEIPVNIVDLGLVYDLSLVRQPSGNSKVSVKMTLTAPGCGMGPMIAKDAQEKLLYLPGVEEAEVEVVWNPPWHQSMISAEGRKVLGLD